METTRIYSSTIVIVFLFWVHVLISFHPYPWYPEQTRFFFSFFSAFFFIFTCLCVMTAPPFSFHHVHIYLVVSVTRRTQHTGCGWVYVIWYVFTWLDLDISCSFVSDIFTALSVWSNSHMSLSSGPCSPDYTEYGSCHLCHLGSFYLKIPRANTISRCFFFTFVFKEIVRITSNFLRAKMGICIITFWRNQK